MLIITFIFPGGRIHGFTILSPSHFWVVFYLGSQIKNLSGILRLHVFRIFDFMGFNFFLGLWVFLKFKFWGPLLLWVLHVSRPSCLWVFIVLAELQDFMYWILCISCPLELYQNSVGLPT